MFYRFIGLLTQYLFILLQFRLPEEVFEEFNRNPIDLSRQSAILRDFAENLPIMTYTNTNGNTIDFYLENVPVQCTVDYV